MDRPQRLVTRMLIVLALLGSRLPFPGAAGADDVGVYVPPPKSRVLQLEQPPEYGVYYDRWEPTIYTGFAPRTLDSGRLHLHVGRGNQLRATAVLSERAIAQYALDLEVRVTTYRRLTDQKRIVPTQNDGLDAMQATLSEVGLPKLVAAESELAPSALQRRNLDLMKRLNPGRVFEIEIDEEALMTRWVEQLQASDRGGLERDRRLVLLNEMLPTRLWISEVDAPTRAELAALVALAPDPADAAKPKSPEFRQAYFTLFDRISSGYYPRSEGKLRFAEFTAIYPIGTFNDYTEYKGHKIPLYPTPGLRALTTHQRTKTADHIPTKVNYSYSPWLPYMHVGSDMHNSFHTLWWQMEPEKARFLPSDWLEDDPRRKNGASRYLWLLSRGPMSHGCTHVNVGHITELRQLIPSDVADMYDVKVYLNRSYDYDVFDIDGDLTPEVMGVQYYIAFSLRNKKPDALRVRNERHAFYQWLYGDEIRYREDGSAWFPEVEDGRFVEKTAKRGRIHRDLDLYEAAYEPEKIQFYKLVDIDFARRLRQVAYAHPFEKTAAASAP